MFGSIGGPELILIAVLALLLFGPRKLPEMGRSLGRALSEFRNATREFKSGLEKEVELEQVQQAGTELASVGREINATVGGTPRLPAGRLLGDEIPPANPPDGPNPRRS